MSLVLIPGIGSDATVWEGMPPGQVMRPDGESIAAMADDVLARAPARFALAGHSMGGYVALALVERAPERVERLALLSTSANADDIGQADARRALITAAAADFEGVIRVGLRIMLHGPSRDDPGIVEPIAAMMRRIGLATFLRQQRATLARPDRHAMLGAIAVPTLVLAGAQDRVVAADRSQAMAAAIPGAQYVRLEDCGHIPQRERPEATRDALARWLEGGRS